MTLDRRTFIGTMGAALLAVRKGVAASIPRLGVQLYTVRGEMEKDFDGTLAKVAAIGFKEVEFAGYFNQTPQQVRDALKRHRLTAPSAHIDYPSLTGDKWKSALESARTIGHTYLIVGRRVDPQPAGCLEADRETYNRRGREQARRHPVRHHNHNFEFTLKDPAGKLPYDFRRVVRSRAREDGAGPVLISAAGKIRSTTSAAIRGVSRTSKG